MKTSIFPVARRKTSTKNVQGIPPCFKTPSSIFRFWASAATDTSLLTSRARLLTASPTAYGSPKNHKRQFPLFRQHRRGPEKRDHDGHRRDNARKKILMLASGKNKADAVFRMISGKIDESCPASVLQLHPSVTVILDKEAASKL